MPSVQSRQTIALLILPPKVLERPRHERRLAVHLHILRRDALGQVVPPELVLRAVDGRHLVLAQRHEVDVVLDAPLGRALGDHADAALHCPRERHDARRAPVRLGNVGEELVIEDEVLSFAVAAAECPARSVSNKFAI